MSLQMSFFTVELRNGVTHKIWAENIEAAEALVIFDKELVSPQNRQAEQMARPKVSVWVDEPIVHTPKPQVTGHFKVGDSMVHIFERTFVRRSS